MSQFIKRKGIQYEVSNCEFRFAIMSDCPIVIDVGVERCERSLAKVFCIRSLINILTIRFHD